MAQDTLASAQPSPAPARISKIADRYLVFSSDDVAQLRREHNLCSVLVGCTPQNPTQNVFLSLPLELLPEEAAYLLEKGAAVLVDEAKLHLDALRARDGGASRQPYLERVKELRSQARRHLAEEQAQKDAQTKEFIQKAKEGKGSKSKKKRKNERKAEKDSSEDTPPVDDALFGAESSAAAGTATATASKSEEHGPQGTAVIQTMITADSDAAAAETNARSLAVTPGTSSGLLPPSAVAAGYGNPKPSAVIPFHKHLLTNGYFMTPGLRFGSRYSVYPGDPLRYHAHFLAIGYEWDEEIAMLDVVGTGRLGTSVKKGYLIGGESPAGEDGKKHIRTFTLEWAGM